MALYTIRLDKESEDVLANAAAARGVSRAVVLRQAVAEYGKNKATPRSIAEAWAPLIGVIKDGPGNLSENTGTRFAEALAADRLLKDKQGRPVKARKSR